MPHGFTGFINDEENGLRFDDLRIKTGIYMQFPRLIALRKWKLDFYSNITVFSSRHSSNGDTYSG